MNTALLDTLHTSLASWLQGQDLQGMSPSDLPVQPTRPEFDGQYTLVLFPWVKKAKMPLQALGQSIGDHLKANLGQVSDYSLVKGFLNISLSDSYWLSEVIRASDDQQPVPQDASPRRIMIEYGSPNANKPLHLGHLRNLLLGWSVGRILAAVGHDIHYTQIVNDRGIAICKSMMCYQRHYKGQTPEDLGKKGDHFIGECYVRFGQELAEEYKDWQSTSTAKEVYQSHRKETEEPASFFKRYQNDYFNAYSVIGQDTRSMLQAWEAGDEATVGLWRQMSDWFMDGFSQTIQRLGLRFDSMQFESDTYLVGKAIVEQGLKDGVFAQDPDGSVWIDLTNEGLDRKLVLRSDGTSVYMTQDIGTGRIRYDEYQMDGVIYTVGNEQEYHFQVLFHILKKLGEPYADLLYHLSYGMVSLPTGKMKTREGTVVDADDLIEEVIGRVEANSQERGELDHLTSEERSAIIEKIGFGALKYYLLRVEARKGMQFDPEESVDLHGQTGPYIQNAFVRIKSILRRWSDVEMPADMAGYPPTEVEKEVLMKILQYGADVLEAADKKDPSIVARYAYDLSKLFHRFYHDHSIIHADTPAAQAFRLKLALLVADRLERSMDLLGIDMPTRM